MRVFVPTSSNIVILDKMKLFLRLSFTNIILSNFMYTKIQLNSIVSSRLRLTLQSTHLFNLQTWEESRIVFWDKFYVDFSPNFHNYDQLSIKSDL